MTESENQVSHLVKETVRVYSEELSRQRSELYLNYMQAEASDRNVYSNFYSFNSEQALKGNLILFDDAMTIKFSSENSNFEENALSLYLTLVASNLSAEDEVIQRVYRDRNKDYNLILFTTIADSEGYVAYIINGKEIKSYLSQLPDHFIIYDNYHTVLASSSSQFINGVLNKVQPAEFENHFFFDSKLYFARVDEISQGLNLIIYQRSVNYLSLFKLIVLIVLVLMLIMLVFTSWFSKKISIRNAHSVELLSSEMEQIVGDANKTISLKTGDEFEIISTKINKMLNELSQVHDKNIDLLKESLQAERKMLEAQFNPHFLYNTLEVIRASILFDPKLANELILKLTKILRYSIDNNIKDITLGFDLQYLEEYLLISKIRFEDFNYTFDIDEETLDFIIPKLFLLPVIENSLKYGFQYRSDLKIDISIKKESDRLTLIRVIDNGQAMSVVKAFEINQHLRHDIQMKNHHGLMNSKRRIELMYPDTTFEIKVEEGFTIVEIRIGDMSNV